jgi:hypothetical protein
MATAAEAVFEDLVLPQGEFGADTKSEDEFGGGTKFGDPPNSEALRAAEDRAIECFVALERAELKHGIEFGRAMIELRDQKKAAGERDWMAYLERIGISYEIANKWINKVESRETKHGKKKPKAEPAGAAAEPESVVADWEKLADELQVLTDYACRAKRQEQPSASFMSQLSRLSGALGFELKEKTQ